MTLLHFAQSLNSITEKSALIAMIGSFVNDHSVEKVDTQKLKAFIESILDDDFTSFGQNLGFCKSHCIEELGKESNKNDEDYCNKLTKVKQLLDELSKIYQDINEQREATKVQYDESYTLVQQKDVLRELKAQTKELKNDIDKANRDIIKANDSLDNKMFTLLINTVAILGIFVAIAFAGLGITSLFNNINFTEAFISQGNLVKSVFFLLLIATLSYNLLLLLVYFIYRLSRPLSEIDIKTSKGKSQDRFTNTVKLTPFMWIDGIMSVFTIATFVWCQFL